MFSSIYLGQSDVISLPKLNKSTVQQSLELKYRCETFIGLQMLNKEKASKA